MTMNRRDELKRRRLAKKLGEAFTFTRMVEDHSADAREYLTSVTKRRNIGKPIAACFYSTDKWSMVTTSHLAWKYFNRFHCIRFQDISRLDYSKEDKARILRDNSVKARVDSLEVKSKEGSTYVIPLEPDIAFYIFWRAANIFVGTKFGRESS